jgi:hypothetical protein
MRILKSSTFDEFINLQNSLTTIRSGDSGTGRFRICGENLHDYTLECILIVHPSLKGLSGGFGF